MLFFRGDFYVYRVVNLVVSFNNLIVDLFK